ncbi:MAG: aminotransferase class V-fold PLP-dependent enzyme, partial [Hyphomicrobium sp.]
MLMTGVYRDLFDVPEEIVYLNCANLAPRLRSVSEAGKAAMDRLGSPWSISPRDWFEGAERLRGLFATLVNASPDSVSLVPSVSYGVAIAAKNVEISSGSNVVVLDQQYPSNVYAWRRVCAEKQAQIRTVFQSDRNSLTEAVLAAINEKTSVVTIPNCHWTDGALLDVEQVGRAARQVDAALIVDASQSLGAYPLDVKAVQPDFLVSVGYKWLLGPYGLGYLYAHEKWQRDGIPIEESWLTRAGSEDFARSVEYVDEYRPGARRFDFGEFPQFLSLPMACAALSQLIEWKVETIHSLLTDVTNT